MFVLDFKKLAATEVVALEAPKTFEEVIWECKSGKAKRSFN